MMIIPGMQRRDIKEPTATDDVITLMKVKKVDMGQVVLPTQMTSRKCLMLTLSTSSEAVIM